MRAVSVVLALVAVLAQVAYPLTPSEHLPELTVATVIIFAAASVTHATASRGVRWAACYTVTVMGVGLAVEAVGVATGFPFGGYDYADTLGPQVWDVPLIIPLAWTMMAYPAYVAARHLVPDRRVTRVLVASWALASWDLFLDPQMVGEGHWSWAGGVALPGVPGIPVSNYLGWLGVSLLIMTLLEGAGRLAPPVEGPLPVTARDAADWVPLGLYLWTYASSVMAALVFFGNPGAAVWGGLAMGAVAVPLLRYFVRAVRAERPGRSGSDDQAAVVPRADLPAVAGDPAPADPRSV